MQTVNIGPLKAQHRDQWLGLWAQLTAFYGSELAKGIYDQSFARLTDKDQRQTGAFLALNEHEAVGMVHFVAYPHNWKPEPVCYLQDLFIVPSHRRQGLAQALIEKVAQHAQAMSWAPPHWMTNDDNVPARALYDRIATLTPYVKYQL